MDQRVIQVFQKYQQYPPVFAVVMGPHAYGYGCPHSTYEVTVMHLLPTEEICGLRLDTTDHCLEERYFAMDLKVVIHSYDMADYMRAMLNGYISLLEALFSPLILAHSTTLYKLSEIAKSFVTRALYDNYRHIINRERGQLGLHIPYPPRHRPAESILKLLRQTLTAVHLLDTGEIELNLLTLVEHHEFPEVHELIAKYHSDPYALVEERLVQNLTKRFHRLLRVCLKQAHAESDLPETVSHDARDSLNLLLSITRMKFSMNENR